MAYSKRAHEMAVGAATAFATANSQREMQLAEENNKIYDPNTVVEDFEEAYLHAYEHFSAQYHD